MSRVLITGASSGIGYELAQICLKNGHEVVAVARTKKLLSSIKSGNVTYIIIDLAQPGAAQQLFQELKKQHIQDIDILVNNAGVGDYALFMEANPKRLRAMMQLNMITLTELTHMLLPYMKRRGSGKVMNLASTASFTPGPYMAVYYATKHYVLAFGEALAEELKGTGITVTTLCPGPTKSKFETTAGLSTSRLFPDNLPSSHQVAAYGYARMMQGKRISIYGVKNKLFITLSRLLPSSTLAAIVSRASREK